MSCRVLYLILPVVLGFYATLVTADPGGVISVNFSTGDSTSLASASDSVNFSTGDSTSLASASDTAE